jgi:hypothetical protein
VDIGVEREDIDPHVPHMFKLRNVPGTSVGIEIKYLSGIGDEISGVIIRAQYWVRCIAEYNRVYAFARVGQQGREFLLAIERINLPGINPLPVNHGGISPRRTADGDSRIPFCFFSQKFFQFNR